ncbi:MAG: surface lipoprotein assembly modifier [Desulfovibrio sp.]|jgi:tetratricopeptide (TPR) repeat protein|nr:surface lipoprotein assembly modifier [Desulfovibrio sp.]
MHRQRRICVLPGIYYRLSHAALFFFVAAALSFLHGPPAFADDTVPARRTALESAKAEAAALLERGKGTEAYELYMHLLRESPGDDAVHLGLARAAARIGRWNQVVLALEMLLEKYPREAALYDQLAHAYLALNDRAGAERVLEAKQAVARSGGTDTTAFPLDALEQRYSLFQVHGKIRMGALYDSNANQGPDSTDLTLGNWRVEVPDAKARETFGGYLNANLDLGRKFERDGNWWAVGDAQTYIRGNTNNDLGNVHARESQWGRAAVGLRRLSDETLLDVRAKAEIFDYEWYQNVASFGPETTLLLAVTPAAQSITRGGTDRRVYSRDPRRNGLYYYLGQYARFLFSDSNHEITVGAQYRGSSPQKRDYAYDGWEISARMILKLPHGFELAPFASWAEDRYQGPATALETKKRVDEHLRLGGGLTWRINESWSLECNYQNGKNTSTSGLYDYTQQVVSTGVAWSF